MNDSQSIEIFSKAPVRKAVLINALPAMAAMIMTLIYNLADTFFIGQTEDALQVAAVSLAMPVFLIFMAFGTIFGAGGTSVISRALGEDRNEYAKKVCSFCMWCCIIAGTAISALFLIFMDKILTLAGASANTWEYTKSYLSIISVSGPFLLISVCYSNILRAEGKPTQAMTGQIIGNLLNIVLDPIMILIFGWNIAGAAIATVIGNIASACYYLLYFLRGKSDLSINIKHFTLKNKVCSGVLAIGIPASLGSILMSISQIITNSQMANYGDIAVAGMGVAMKVVIITGMVCMGLGQGIQPLLGYCAGAKMWERFKKCLKFSLIFSLILGIALTAVCYLFVSQIVSAFLNDPDAHTYAVKFSCILLSTSWFFGVFYVLINTIQAMGAAVPALFINLSRQGIIFIPALFILQFSMGITGLVWAQPAADILSTGLAIILYKYSARKMTDQRKTKLKLIKTTFPQKANNSI
ncbi:MAG: MATE family efflux transporter [Firmicutes bacterium]|nr:MATE family efflux transporter [Bacillota bacterium]